jgi:hypothetical protein
MAFYADKCFVIRAGTKRKTIKQDYTIHKLHFSTRKHNLVFFFRPNHILIVELHRRFLYILFQENTLGDISFKLETKISELHVCFFLKKKYNQANSSVVNNMQYNLFTIFPLSGNSTIKI